MKHIIFAAALIALCTPAFAGGSHSGGFGGTSATSTSGFEAGGKGPSSASGAFGNVSHGSTSGGASTTTSLSFGAGHSTKNAAWDGYSTGTSGAFTFGGFSHH